MTWTRSWSRHSPPWRSADAKAGQIAFRLLFISDIGQNDRTKRSFSHRKRLYHRVFFVIVSFLLFPRSILLLILLYGYVVVVSAIDLAVDHAVISFSFCVVSPLFRCRFHRALTEEGRYAEGKHAFSSLPMLVPLSFITVSRV